MKLTTKLVLVLLAGALLLLAADSYFSVRREVALFERDMQRDARTVGLTVRSMFTELWDSGQPERAVELIDQVNRHAETLSVRWVPQDSLADRSHPVEAEADSGGHWDEGLINSLWAHDAERALHTYVPVRRESGDLLGVIEIVESRSDLTRYVRTTVLRRLVLVSVLLLVSAAAVILVGVLFVGRPLHKLMDNTRRIGAGDLTSRVQLPGHDELVELADAMNAMVEQLRTSRDQLEAETARRIATLEELRHADRLRTVGRLASGIAHELGTPLNVISGRATMVEEGEQSPEKITESARVIRTQAGRMIGVVRQLLDFARRPQTQRTALDLGRCAAEVRRLLEPLAGKKRIALVLEDPGTCPRAFADRSQIEQVMTNLVINAIHASSEGGQVEISVGSETVESPSGNGGSYAFVRVGDRGTGIPEDAIQHLFEPFFTTKDVGEGTGLGLSVAYTIVQEHEGWIDARNRDGGGAEFTVYLPEAGEHGR